MKHKVFAVLALAVMFTVSCGDGWKETGLKGDIMSLAYAPDSMMYAGTNRGLIFSKDLKRAESIWIPQRGLNVRSVGPDPVSVAVFENEVLATSLEKGAFYRGEFFFVAMNQGFPFPLRGVDYGARCIASIEHDLFLGTDYGVYWRPREVPSNWTSIGLGEGVRAIAVSRAVDEALLVATLAGIYRAENRSPFFSWHNVPWERVEEGNFTTLTAFGFSVWAGSASQGVFHSIDEGKNWWPASYGLPKFKSGYARVNTIFVHPDHGVPYAGTSVGIFKWNGYRWVKWGMSGHDVHAITADDAGNVFAGTDEEVYRYPVK